MNEAQTARDAGIETVLKNNTVWRGNAYRALRNLSPGTCGTFESFRLHLTRRIGEPTHHNAWGGLCSGAIRKKILEPTGRYAQMKTKKSHARMTPILRRPFLK